MANDFYNDKELKELFGLRPSGQPLFEPEELGWACPQDKKHRITWSEFEKHIWCTACDKDYFTLLCPKAMNPLTTKKILESEKAKMQPLIDRWNIEKYRRLKHDGGKEE